MKIAAFLFATFLQHSFAYHLGFYVPLPKKDTWSLRNGRGYAHALTVAVDDVNNDPSILPGHKLTYNWTESTDSAEVLRTMYEKYIPSHDAAKDSSKTPVDVFIGPAFHCSAPAKIAEAFNIPMISYVSVLLM
jgi:hypothetical protein